MIRSLDRGECVVNVLIIIMIVRLTLMLLLDTTTTARGTGRIEKYRITE